MTKLSCIPRGNSPEVMDILSSEESIEQKAKMILDFNHQQDWIISSHHPAYRLSKQVSYSDLLKLLKDMS